MKNYYNLNSTNDGMILHERIILQYLHISKNLTQIIKYICKNTKTKHKNNVKILYEQFFSISLKLSDESI